MYRRLLMPLKGWQVRLIVRHPSALNTASGAKTTADAAAVDASAAKMNAESAINAFASAAVAATDAKNKARTALANAEQALTIAVSVAGNIPVINVNALCGSGIYTLPSARIAITDKSGTDKTEYRNVGSVITYTVDANQWETKQFIGSSLDEWLDDTKWTGFGGSGKRIREWLL